MKILAMDIGFGTLDVLLYDSERELENCVKLVLPSPSQVFAAKLRQVTEAGQQVFLRGDVVGGGALTGALKDHVYHGLKAYMTPKAAYSIRNRLEEVERLGVTLLEEPPQDFSGVTLTLEEVGIHTLNAFLRNSGETILDVDAVAIALKDHGSPPPGVTNRRFRHAFMEERIRRDPRLHSLALRAEEVPEGFMRMASAVEAARRQIPGVKVVLMDTSPAGLLGCLRDPRVRDIDPLAAVNLGNGHTMAALISRERLLALWEHHTGALDAAGLERMVRGMARGTLTDADIESTGGHGLIRVEDAPAPRRISLVSVTGPKREKAGGTRLPVYYAAPGGDMMMAGPLGLIEAVEKSRLV